MMWKDTNWYLQWTTRTRTHWLIDILCERERERETGEREREKQGRERERESACVCVCVCVKCQYARFKAT